MPTRPRGAGSFKRLRRALGHSLEGLKSEFKHEPAFRLEVYILLILVPVAIALPVAPLSRSLLVGSLLIIMIVELINNAFESTVDYISLERNPLAKRIKDALAGSVLIAIVNAVVIWAAVIFEFASK
jgi:diacylglycerol kinase (ATP)